MKLKTCLALLSGLILGVAFAEDGYIQSDGTQFVNTGYHVKETTRLEIDYQLISFVGQDRIFCGDGFDNTIAVEFYVQGTATNSGTLAFIYGNPYQTASKVATATLDRTKASIDFEKGVCTIGTSKATLNKSYITGQASGGVPVALFGKNTKAAGDVADYRATMKLYGFKVYESDVLVHDYVPAKKDGEVGLYDEVGGGFITRGSAHALACGGDVKVITSDHYGDYIESDGTQFVNTGYFPGPTSRIELDYSIPTFADTTDYVQMRLMDCHPTAQNDASLAATVYVAGTAENGDYTLAMAICNRAKGASLSGTWVSTDAGGVGEKGKYCDNARRTLVLDERNKTMAILEAGVRKWYRTVSTANTNKSLWPLALFGRPGNLYGNKGEYHSRIRVYGLKIYEANSLIHDYRPVRKDGVVGLYDDLTGAFLFDTRTPATSAGTFTASANIAEMGDYAYVEAFGRASDGINARFCKTPTTKMEVEFAFTSVTDADKQARVFGMDTASTKMSAYINASKNFSFGMNDDFLGVSTGIQVDMRRHLATIDLKAKRLVYQTGAGGVWTTNWWHTTAASYTNTLTATRPLAIAGNMANNYGTTFSTTAPPKMKVYACRIWDDGVLKHDYVPCVKGGVPGFKDKVDGAFVTNERKSEAERLGCGGDIPIESDDDYILSDGRNNQTIDTGYQCTGSTRIEADYAFTATNQPFGHQQVLFGNVTDKVNFNAYINGSSCYAYSCYTVNENGAPGRYIGSGVANSLARKTIIIDAVERQAYVLTAGYTNQVLTSFPAAADLEGKKNAFSMPIFNRRNGDGTYGTLQPAAKLYGLRIYEGGELVRNYVPARKDGVAGLSDTVDGGFVSPNVAATPVPLVFGGKSAETGGEAAYVESDGSQTINLGYKAKGTSRIEFDYSFVSMAGDKTLCGAWKPGSGQSLNLRYTPWNSGAKFQCIFNGSTSDQRKDFGGVVDLNRHLMVMDMKNRQLSFDNGAAKTYTVDFTDETVCEIPMGVFGTFTDAAATKSDNMRAIARCYGVKVYEDDQLVHEYVPYWNGTEAGLYDLFDKSFHGDALKSATPLKIGGSTYGDGTFTTQPQDGTVFADGTLTLKAFAPAAVGYQWYKDGKALEGETDETLGVSWQRKPRTAVYTVKATFNPGGTTVVVESDSATVTFCPNGALMIIR